MIKERHAPCSSKYAYNAAHCFVFVIPLLGYLLIRNSSLYLCERYSAFLECMGRNTLETYVLQFHLLMTKNVQHVIVLIPGSHVKDGNELLKAINMLACGLIYCTAALVARRATVETQSAVAGFVRDATARASGREKREK